MYDFLIVRRNFVKVFDAGKTRMIGLPYGEKNYHNTLSRSHTIPERNGRTDGQTGRQTDGQTDKFGISISRVSMVTRDNKIVCNLRRILNRNRK